MAPTATPFWTMSALVCVSILPLKLIYELLVHFLLAYRICFEHTTSAGEVFALMNADATGLDFSRPLE